MIGIKFQGLIHSRQVFSPLSIHVLSVSDVSKQELLQAFQVTASLGPRNFVPPGHSGDDGLGPRICTQAGEGTRNPLFRLDRSHPRTFSEADGQLLGAVAQMLGSYSPGFVLWPCGFHKGP